MKIFSFLIFTVLLIHLSAAAEAPLDVKQSSLKFTGHATLHDFKGEAKDFRGSAQVDSKKPELVLGARIDIQTASLTTFESGRDRNMFEWLHAGANPAISFRLTKVTLVKGDPARVTKDYPALFAVSGTFTLNKSTKLLETQAQGWREGSRLVVTGAAKIDTAEYGLPIVKQFFMTVDKDVDVTFHLVFDLPPESSPR